MIIIKYHLGNGKQVYEKWEETATARSVQQIQTEFVQQCRLLFFVP